MNISVSQTDDLAACLLLRRRVFVDEQGVPKIKELGSYDASAIHLLVQDGNIPVGTALIHALVFYERLGFPAFGREYLDAGISHFDMGLAA